MKKPDVVFVDWHGTLCRDVFWHSIRNKPKHPLHDALSGEMDLLLGRDRHLYQDWLRGKTSSEMMCRDLAMALKGVVTGDALLRQLYCGIAAMRFDMDLWHELRATYPKALLVIATDNIDEFADVYRDTRRGYRLLKPIAPILPPTFRAMSLLADGFICSSNRGVLKAEDPLGFFGPFLGELGIGFEDAMLIDDSSANCRAFFEVGGQAKLHRNWPDVLAQETIEPSAIWEEQGLVKPLETE